MFMRYQLGMSVGHAYMHADPFPPPSIPSIPQNFDHCATPIPKPGMTAPGTPLLRADGDPEPETGEEGVQMPGDGIGEAEGGAYEEPLELDHDGDRDLDFLEDLDDGEFALYHDMYGDGAQAT